MSEILRKGLKKKKTHGGGINMCKTEFQVRVREGCSLLLRGEHGLVSKVKFLEQGNIKV